MELDYETQVGMYTKMLTIRHFEERASKLFAEGKIPGFVHLSIGQEAPAVGTCTNLRSDDWIATSHRGHAHVLAKGAELKPMFAELLGKAPGYCKGKSGSMHIAEFSIGILGAIGIVGGQFPLCVGAAFAAKYSGKDSVAVPFFGDGASNQGTFHESANLAAVWKLPVIFLCENNGYAEFTGQPRHQAIKDIAIRAAGYGMPGVTVDGMDVLAVYKAVNDAVKRARAGEGPSLIECKTYRYHGHAEGDDGHLYRTDEEVAQWKAKDAIVRFRKHLVDHKIVTDQRATDIENQVLADIDEAVKYAEAAPPPSVDEIYTDVYAP